MDEVKELVGGTCTIFQRMNENGDMLRVATNVIAADKSRAIETFIPAQNADGSPNPVVSALVKGQKFLGRAYVVEHGTSQPMSQLSWPLLDIEATTTFLVTLTEGALFALGVLLGVLKVAK